MIDAIYELYNGEYVDLSNLVVVENVYFDDWRIPSVRMESQEPWGHLYFNCRFRFIKDPVKFVDDKRVTGDNDIEERKKFVEQQRSRMVQEWSLFKGLEKV